MTRAEQEFSAKDTENIELLDDDVRRRMKIDPMFRLEHIDKVDTSTEKEKRSTFSLRMA